MVIAEYLSNDSDCAGCYSDGYFSVISKARFAYNLSVLNS